MNPNPTTDSNSGCQPTEQAEYALMTCHNCGSEDLDEFVAETNIHFRGLPNINHPGVLILPKLTVCFDGGLSQFRVTAAELALLAKGRTTKRADMGLEVTHVEFHRRKRVSGVGLAKVIMADENKSDSSTNSNTPQFLLIGEGSFFGLEKSPVGIWFARFTLRQQISGLGFGMCRE